MAKSVFDANKAEQIPVAYVNAFQSKNLAIVNISGFTMGRIGLATGLKQKYRVVESMRLTRGFDHG